MNPLPQPVIYILSGVFGAMVGSFFNVIIYRMPRGESVVYPPSSCTRCGYRIRFYENFPILSWLALRGKCRNCGDPISVQYPLVEAFSGIMAVVVAGLLLHAVPEAHLDFKVAFAYLVLSLIHI